MSWKNNPGIAWKCEGSNSLEGMSGGTEPDVRLSHKLNESDSG